MRGALGGDDWGWGPDVVPEPVTPTTMPWPVVNVHEHRALQALELLETAVFTGLLRCERRAVREARDVLRGRR